MQVVVKPCVGVIRALGMPTSAWTTEKLTIGLWSAPMWLEESGDSDFLGGSNQGLVDVENNAKAHTYIRFYQSWEWNSPSTSLKVQNASQSFLYIGCVWLQVLMVLPGWKFNINQPWFGSQSHPHVLGSCHCGFLVPSWSEAPRSPVSSLSLETLQRLDPKTKVLCTPVMPLNPHPV